MRTWLFCLTQTFSNGTFLFCVLLTRHFNMKGHLSFVSVHIHLSAFQMARWEVPEKVIFVSWVLGLHSILVFSLDFIMLLLGKCHGNAFSDS